jgi:hypothetical protein
LVPALDFGSILGEALVVRIKRVESRSVKLIRSLRLDERKRPLVAPLRTCLLLSKAVNGIKLSNAAMELVVAFLMRSGWRWLCGLPKPLIFLAQAPQFVVTIVTFRGSTAPVA